MFNRLYMGSLNLGTPTAVDKAQARYGAAFTIGSQHGLSEIAIADCAVGKLINAFLHRKVVKWGRLVLKTIGRIPFSITRQNIFVPP